MKLGRIVDEGAKVRGRAFAGVAAAMFTVAGFGLIGVVAALPGGSAALPEASAGRPEPMLRASWMWTGGGSTDAWTNAQNWSGAGGACVYPCNSTDDVTFNSTAHVNLGANRTIDDLLLSGLGYGLDFDGEGTERTITCDTLVITHTGGGATVTDLAGVVTN